jgi:hypothetical protein
MLKALAAALTVLMLAASFTPASAAPMTDLQYLKGLCAGAVDNLPVVRKQTVAAIGAGTSVSVRSICRGINLSTVGNAGGLGKTIDANPTLRAALATRGWRGDDVVGIRISSGNVVLYVHRF